MVRHVVLDRDEARQKPAVVRADHDHVDLALVG
jgi:hypothetical protein